MKLKAADFDSYSYLGVGSAFDPNGVPVAAIAPALALAVNGPGTPQGMGSSDPEEQDRASSPRNRVFVSNFSGMFNFTLGAFHGEAHDRLQHLRSRA